MIFPQRGVRKNTGNQARTRRQNAMLHGHGASTAQDRGAHQGITLYGSNPAASPNYLYRWQEYTRLYMTAWEARKIIDIPVEDALRNRRRPERPRRGVRFCHQ